MFCLFCFRLNFSTAFSSNAVSICQKVGITAITRVEVSVRYLIDWEQNGLNIGKDLENQVGREKFYQNESTFKTNISVTLNDIIFC